MNPAKPMTIYDIPGLVKTVFPSAMTPRNIQSGFKVTGLWPFNPDIFQECDFAAAQVANRPNPNNVTKGSKHQILSAQQNRLSMLQASMLIK